MRAFELISILAMVHPDTEVGVWCPTNELMFHVEEILLGEEFGQNNGCPEVKDDDFIVLELSGQTYGETIDHNGEPINESASPY